MGGVPDVAKAPKRPSSVGPLMSDRSALGASQEMSGRRAKAPGDVSRSFIPAKSFCWRRARVRSLSFGRQSFLRVRARARAWSPSSRVVPGLRRSV